MVIAGVVQHPGLLARPLLRVALCDTPVPTLTARNSAKCSSNLARMQSPIKRPQDDVPGVGAFSSVALGAGDPLNYFASQDSGDDLLFEVKVKILTRTVAQC